MRSRLFFQGNYKKFRGFHYTVVEIIRR